jgi:quinol monooxygenase YgiN
MIVVSGTAEVQPSKRQQAIELFKRLMSETTKEDGNISYHFYIDIENENVFRVFEQWQSQAALEAHFATDHMAELNRELPKLIAAPPELTRYDIADSAPLPL